MEKKVITVEEFKEENTRLLQSMLAMNGGFEPVVTGLIIKPDGQYAIAIFPLPENALDSEESKRKIPMVMPKLFDSFRKEGITPICFSFTSEAWLRTLDKNQEKPNNWKDLPKKEAFISSYETADDVEMEVSLIHREGKIANDQGELIDAIRLERVHEMDRKNPDSQNGGLLMNMFQKELKKWKKDGKSTD